MPYSTTGLPNTGRTQFFNFQYRRLAERGPWPRPRDRDDDDMRRRHGHTGGVVLGPTARHVSADQRVHQLGGGRQHGEPDAVHRRTLDGRAARAAAGDDQHRRAADGHRHSRDAGPLPPDLRSERDVHARLRTLYRAEPVVPLRRRQQGRGTLAVPRDDSSCCGRIPASPRCPCWQSASGSGTARTSGSTASATTCSRSTTKTSRRIRRPAARRCFCSTCTTSWATPSKTSSTTAEATSRTSTRTSRTTAGRTPGRTSAGSSTRIIRTWRPAAGSRRVSFHRLRRCSLSRN